MIPATRFKTRSAHQAAYRTAHVNVASKTIMTPTSIKPSTATPFSLECITGRLPAVPSDRE